MASTLIVALAALSLSVATAWFSDSGELHHSISAAPSFGERPDKVWVCRLVGPMDDPRVADGKNPIFVSVNSVEGEHAFSDAHPSYVVDNGETECHTPDAAFEPEESVVEGAAPEGDQTTSNGSDGEVTSGEDGSPEQAPEGPGAPGEPTEPGPGPSGIGGDQAASFGG